MMYSSCQLLGRLGRRVAPGDLVEGAVEVSSPALGRGVGEEVVQERRAQTCGDWPEGGGAAAPEEGSAFVGE